MAPTNNSTTWTTPRTWSTGELVTASIMNTHVRDNLNALKTPAGGYNTLNLGADITTTSTSFADVDSTNLSLTFTTGGGDVLIFFLGAVSSSANTSIYLDIYESVAAGRLGTDDGLYLVGANTVISFIYPAVICFRATGLSAASHNFKLQWKTGSGTATMYAGAGTANKDVHPHFFAVEI